MITVYKTPYTLVTEHNGMVTIKRRSQVIFIIAVLGLVIGALAYFGSGLRLSADGAIEGFCFWAAAIILIFFMAQGISSITDEIIFAEIKLFLSFKKFFLSQTKLFLSLMKSFPLQTKLFLWFKKFPL